VCALYAKFRSAPCRISRSYEPPSRRRRRRHAITSSKTTRKRIISIFPKRQRERNKLYRSKIYNVELVRVSTSSFSTITNTEV